MNFIQPFILYALPLIGLPILIHLINQRRYRTIHWAATMFLLQARRMARGMARLRYWLLMLARMLAIAALIFAVARPMAGGWLGLTTDGAPELAIVVLDRSASMEETDPATGRSHRESSLQKLQDLLSRFDGQTRIVMFDSGSDGYQELAQASDLLDLPVTEMTEAAADIPGMMQRVTDFIIANEVGRTDVWLCSDMRRNDWDPVGGRWNELKTQLQSRTGVRCYVLSSSDSSDSNLAVSVSGVHRRTSAEGAEVVMDIKVTRATPTDAPITVPLALTIDGARSTLELELTGAEVVRNGHIIPVSSESVTGWGRIELPHDANPADNTYQFVYAEPPVRRTVVVAENTDVGRFLQIAAATPSNRNLTFETQIIAPAAAATIAWNETALVLWQAPLPTGAEAQMLQDFVKSGRSVIFFPPNQPTADELFGTRWETWTQPDGMEFFPLSRWKTDADLLGNSLAGNPLPVGQLRTYQACQLEQQRAIAIASLQSGPPLLSRIATESGGVWFCATLPTPAHSNLVTNGVVFYVMIQRALAAGAASLGAASYQEAGKVALGEIREWQPVDPRSSDVSPSMRSLRGGLYQADGRMVAINRPLAEDDTTALSSDELQQTLQGLDFVQIQNSSDSSDSLASEVWRTFLVLMILALLGEALLCVPEASRRVQASFPNLTTTAKS